MAQPWRAWPCHNWSKQSVSAEFAHVLLPSPVRRLGEQQQEDRPESREARLLKWLFLSALQWALMQSQPILLEAFNGNASVAARV